MKFFLPLLGLLFIALKLTNVIAWSWWLVLLPLYGGLAFLPLYGGLAFLLGILALFAILAIISKVRPLGR